MCTHICTYIYIYNPRTHTFKRHVIITPSFQLCDSNWAESYFNNIIKRLSNDIQLRRSHQLVHVLSCKNIQHCLAHRHSTKSTTNSLSSAAASGGQILIALLFESITRNDLKNTLHNCLPGEMHINARYFYHLYYWGSSS